MLNLKHNKMKKLIIVFIVSLIGFNSYSQNTQAEKTAKKVVDKWVEACNLDRKTQVAHFIVLLEKQEAILKVKEEYGKESEIFLTTKKTINKEYSIKITEVVGPEATAIMSEYRKNKRTQTAQG